MVRDHERQSARGHRSRGCDVKATMILTESSLGVRNRSGVEVRKGFGFGVVVSSGRVVCSVMVHTPPMCWSRHLSPIEIYARSFFVGTLVPVWLYTLSRVGV